MLSPLIYEFNPLIPKTTLVGVVAIFWQSLSKMKFRISKPLFLNHRVPFGVFLLKFLIKIYPVTGRKLRVIQE